MTRSHAAFQGQSVLELDEVSLVFREGRSDEVHALRRVSLEVRQGDVVGVLGPSGSGKTSLLEVASGLRRPTSGRVRLLGNNIELSSAKAVASVRQKGVRLVFQAENLVPYLTALENVQLMGAIAGLRAMKASEAASLLRGLGLPPSAVNALPKHLSGGQQQRVAVARAVVGSPRLVLADEPTARLDRRTAASSLGALCEATGRSGAALVVVSHDEDLVDRYCSRILRLDDGELVSGDQHHAVQRQGRLPVEPRKSRSESSGLNPAAPWGRSGAVALQLGEDGLSGLEQ